jgi:hypothetical protein
MIKYFIKIGKIIGIILIMMLLILFFVGDLFDAVLFLPNFKEFMSDGMYGYKWLFFIGVFLFIIPTFIYVYKKIKNKDFR